MDKHSESDGNLTSYTDTDSIDSLFDEPPGGQSSHNDQSTFVAVRCGPPIPGLYYVPEVPLPIDLEKSILKRCIALYFTDNDVNQVMLFGRAPDLNPAARNLSDNISIDPLPAALSRSGLPSFLDEVLKSLSHLLRPNLPAAVYDILFPPPTAPIRARQAIINLYRPGEGITAHVDLLRRFGDGIIGVSLGSGTVMRFEKANVETLAHQAESSSEADGEQTRWDVYLPERSVVVLTGDARYRWTHAIDRRLEDYVETEDETGNLQGRWIPRGQRMSITFRWLLPGAEIVGSSDDEESY